MVSWVLKVCIRRVEKFYKKRATKCGYIDLLDNLLEVVDNPPPPNFYFQLKLMSELGNSQKLFNQSFSIPLADF